MTLAGGARQAGANAIYFGTSGDVLSGGWNAAPRSFRSLDRFIDFTVRDYIQYESPTRSVLNALADSDWQDLQMQLRNVTDHEEADIANVALALRIENRNFRRIRGFTTGAYLNAAPIHFFHDIHIADFYWSLTYRELIDQRAHCKLCSFHSAALGKQSATSYRLGVAYEPYVAPLGKAMIPSGIKRRLRHALHGKPSGRPYDPEVVSQMMDAASSLGFEANGLRSFMRNEPDTPLVEYRLSLIHI